MRKTGLTLKEITMEANGFRYVTHRISGTMPDGERIRKQFNDRAEAVLELGRLNVRAANTGEVRPVITRLSTDQLAEAEAAFRRLGPDKRLTEAVEWYVANYRPAVVAKTISEADTAFRASKALKPRKTATESPQSQASNASRFRRHH